MMCQDWKGWEWKSSRLGPGYKAVELHCGVLPRNVVSCGIG